MSDILERLSVVSTEFERLSTRSPPEEPEEFVWSPTQSDNILNYMDDGQEISLVHILLQANCNITLMVCAVVMIFSGGLVVLRQYVVTGAVGYGHLKLGGDDVAWKPELVGLVLITVGSVLLLFGLTLCGVAWKDALKERSSEELRRRLLNKASLVVSGSVDIITGFVKDLKSREIPLI